MDEKKNEINQNDQNNQSNNESRQQQTQKIVNRAFKCGADVATERFQTVENAFNNATHNYVKNWADDVSVQLTGKPWREGMARNLRSYRNCSG